MRSKTRNNRGVFKNKITIKYDINVKNKFCCTKICTLYMYQVVLLFNKTVL